MQTLYAKIKGGKITHNNPRYFEFQLSKLEGKNVKIEIIKNIRSLEANNYYWAGIMETIEASTGNDKMALHKLFKQMFLPKELLVWRGIERKIEPTTTRLSTTEFIDYTTKIIAEAGELGINIPSPRKEDLPDFITL